MTTDHQQLAERYLAMLNEHDPDAVEGFVAAGYINHNPFVEDGREANRAYRNPRPTFRNSLYRAARSWAAGGRAGAARVKAGVTVASASATLARECAALAGRSALRHLVSSSVRRGRCAAVVTDIWRTESGRSKRFTEPLAGVV